ncbi:MAG: hypothetical protein A3G85_02225 [Elusimicrobia bacterium RIFCSPLOWO2_12_FULL_39_28]|nr:MAG: hypothetical protein A2034_07030 [Elusimicrobia bacterium GWA2_38_7]OGR98403.1 MAG: hypothetical protein A3G85_02225 [Elusimicrobia bacterium RIFCSPLOWO2_12_FULL_39_28]
MVALIKEIYFSFFTIAKQLKLENLAVFFKGSIQFTEPLGILRIEVRDQAVLVNVQRGSFVSKDINMLKMCDSN